MTKVKYKYFILGAIVLSIACVIFGIYFYKWEYRKPFLEVYFFSLNRGRSIFIRTPENQTILVGGGQNSATIREITKVMPFYSRKIDYIILPSATPAQIGGLIDIIDRYEVREIIMPKIKIMATSTALEILLQKIRKNKIHVEEVEKGDIIDIEKDLKINILFPVEGFKFNKSSLPELVLSISHGSTALYLIGNVSKTIQKSIAKDISDKMTKDMENIVEYYNSAGESRVSPDLLEILDPKFIFSTKEKTTHFISDKEKWMREN